MKISRRSMLVGLVATGAGLALPAWAAGGHVISGRAFGGSWRLVVENAQAARGARSIVETVVAEVDRAMSPYRSNSELSLFNGSQTGDWQPMSSATCAVVAQALETARLTQGAFDPTVGPVVSRFGFGPIEGQVGRYQDIVVGAGAIRKHAPGLTIDLCGIAKGYALDRVADGLVEAGLTSAMIEIGGEVRTLGMHPNGRRWQVGIEDPLARDLSIRRVVEPGHLALATSGHSANGVFGPIGISHIIDPHVRRPAQTSLASVSVLASTAMEADALATGLCSLGAAAGIKVAERLGVSALFITDGVDAARETTTGGFDTHIVI